MTRMLPLLAVVLVALVTACTSTPPANRLPELRFDHLPPIRLDVSSIDIVQAYKPPMTEPNVEHLLPVSPARAAENWARDRLRAEGSRGVARFTVLDASVTRQPLQTKSGVTGFFTTEPSERYEATLDVALDVIDPAGRRLAQVEARANRVRAIREDASLNDRQRMQFELVESLMADLNAELERQAQRHLAPYRVGSGG
ncbi:MAG: hypothetical protein WD270_00695 [Acetobacterales bacterium]